MAAYLATGALPADHPGGGPDATCAALPDPDPTAVQSLATSSAARTARGDVVFGRP